MSSTWIILVNWQGAADTIECLESLMRQSGCDFSIMVIDNGSTDDSVSKIQSWAQAAAEAGQKEAHSASALPQDWPVSLLATIDARWQGALPSANIILVKAGANMGFAAANNLGMRLASSDSGALYFWLLNNDTVVAPEALDIQQRCMAANPDLGLLGARLMYYDAPDIVQGVAGGFHYLRARGYHLGAGLQAQELPPRAMLEAEMAYVMGASMFVRRALFETVGGMSEEYFLYFEEIDWAHRIAGKFRMGLEPDAVVWHKEGGSIGTNSRARPSDTGLYYLSAGLLRFYYCHRRSLTPLAICRILREAATFVVKRDLRGAWAMMTAIKDVATGRRRRGHYGSAEFLATDQNLPKMIA